MRHLPALLPYVAISTLIAAGSVALVFTTVDAGDHSYGIARGAGAALPLSSNGRLAYWRQSPSGEFVLWASNLDGSAARSLGTVAANTSRPFATRWTGDGRAVAYATDDSIGVISLDGIRIDIPGLGRMRDAGFRLIDQRWSPSGKRAAATPFFDGSRVFFLAGSVGPTITASGIFVTNPTVWSVRPDGQDLRSERRLEVLGSLRLDGLWPDGRFLMHVGGDQTQFLIGPPSTSLAPSSLLRRAVVGADRRLAIGFGGSRVVRIDLTHGFSLAESAFVVLLDGGISPDAWVRRNPVP